MQREAAMRVIMAGGSGFIGSAVARELLDAGHSVVVLTRSASRARGAVDDRAELIEWDPAAPGAWEAALDGARGVINLSGEPVIGKRWTDPQKRRLRASRIEVTTALVRAIERARVRPAVLVNGSAIGYYGPHG